MKIIPAIYMSKGRCVSYYKGQQAQSTVFSADPLRMARNFEKQNASAVHLVDLDADAAAIGANKKIAKAIAAKTNLKVSYSDGIKSLEEIADLLAGGINAVCLNQFSENLLTPAMLKFGPEKVFFTIRARRNIVDGKTGVEVLDYGHKISEKGAANIIFRDLKAEGSLYPNFDEIEKLVMTAPRARIFAFGGIGKMSDLEILQHTGAYGAIVSRAFFEGILSLSECVEKFR